MKKGESNSHYQISTSEKFYIYAFRKLKVKLLALIINLVLVSENTFFGARVAITLDILQLLDGLINVSSYVKDSTLITFKYSKNYGVSIYHLIIKYTF